MVRMSATRALTNAGPVNYCRVGNARNCPVIDDATARYCTASLVDHLKDPLLLTLEMGEVDKRICLYHFGGSHVYCNQKMLVSMNV